MHFKCTLRPGADQDSGNCTESYKRRKSTTNISQQTGAAETDFLQHIGGAKPVSGGTVLGLWLSCAGARGHSVLSAAPQTFSLK